MDDYEDDYDVGELDDLDLIGEGWEGGYESFGDAIDLADDMGTGYGADDDLFGEGDFDSDSYEDVIDFGSVHSVGGVSVEPYEGPSLDGSGDTDQRGLDTEAADAQGSELDLYGDASIEELPEGHLEDVRDWIGEINPQYDPYDLESPYGANCGSCAAATWDRFNGDDTATASDATLSVQEMEEHTGCRQVEASPEEIEGYVKSLGPGGHAVVGIDRAEGPGHWFNAYTPDGEHVYYVDGQTKEVSGWPPTSLGDVSRWDVSYVIGSEKEGR